MKISLLLEREPFAEIFEETLASFLTNYYQKPCRVKWHSKRPDCFKISNQNEQVWLCNSSLNSIFIAGANIKIFDPIRSEFSTHPNPWRSPVHRIYVDLATAKLFRKLFCSFFISITPPIPDAENTLIVGGNHKIRIINHRTKTVYVILKRGFNPEYLSRELKIRQEYKMLPIPSLREIGQDGTWFSEQYINGTPINRLKDKSRIDSVVAQAFEELHFLLENTVRQEGATEYAETLTGRIKEDIKDNYLLTIKEKQSLLVNVDELVKLVGKRAKPAGGFITTAQTHGDFQPGNILDDNGNVWLIDWEYTRRRQIGYDVLVFLLQSRFPKGLAQRMEAALASDFSGGGNLKLETILDWEDQQQRFLFTALFVLEELCFYLEENRNQQFKALSRGFIQFNNELPSLVKIF